MKLVSACLLGVNCGFKGSNYQNERVIQLLEGEVLIPVCPEQLGGLPTPRVASEQRMGKVYSKTGEDVTDCFNRGAEQVLLLAQLYGIKEAILKQESPSCGCGQIYDGSFTKKLIEGDGVTTALLKANGINVISEEEI